VALEEASLELWFSWISHQNGQNQAGWKLHDIRLPEFDTGLIWFETIAEATIQFIRASENTVYLISFLF
jgi:hypothetical protein